MTKQEYDRGRYLRLRADLVAQRPADPILLLDTATLAYLAGLTDADGSIYVTHTNRLATYYPNVCWAMTHRPTIDWVAGILGSSVYLHNHTNRREHPHLREQWRTGLTGARAQALCLRMIPYMHTKVRQAELVTQFPGDQRRAPGEVLATDVRAERERLGAEISALNQGVS